jgi:crotonobetainyl-CoA:carnitine CoA-transferase CaiB-like acyl-CoA transferase
VDLSSLWAGPLCTNLLHLMGADVTKVESQHRPDGARRGSQAFFELLNAGKRELVLDFRSLDGVAELRRRLTEADVVVEASRPRALEQLGIVADDLLRQTDGPTLWVSITGHGRSGDGAPRVAFGDDAAAAGGLVAFDDVGPCFCADAVADPLTGIVAAVAAKRALRTGGRWLLDVSMAAVAASFAGPTLDAGALVGSEASPAVRRAA